MLDLLFIHFLSAVRPYGLSFKGLLSVVSLDLPLKDFFASFIYSEEEESDSC
jgi:hypothetical protein